jgi:hypothetical protein
MAENNSKKLPYPADGTPVETYGPGFLQTGLRVQTGEL